MILQPASQSVPFYRRVDWVLLCFLLLFTNQAMLSVKLLALLLIYIVRPNLRFGLLRGRLPLFYLVLPTLGLLNLLVRLQDFSPGYLSTLAVSAGFWGCCLLGYHQVKLSLERRGSRVMHGTLQAWTLINLLVSLGQVARIAWRTGKLNPYEGLGFPYGMSTGDKVFGVLFENSYYNLIISAMLAVYFLFRKDFLFSMMAALCLLLVFGNAGTYVFITALTGIFLLTALTWPFRRQLQQSRSLPAAVLRQASPGRHALWVIPLLIAGCLVFPHVVSPSNVAYATSKPESEQPDTSLLAGSDLRWKPDVATLNFAKYDAPSTITPQEDSLDLRRRRYLTLYSIGHFDGKKLSLQETYQYLASSPGALLLGAGPGRFSSQTAHYVSGADTGRLFKRVPKYRSRLYAENHWLITHYRLASEARLLSTLNWPESFYNQLFGEYGLAGLLVFAVFYAGHFLRQARRLSFGWWLCVMMVPFALLSYLFETLCLMTFFELLMEQDRALHSGDAPSTEKSPAP